MDRDLVLAVFLFGSLPFILWRPTLGVFLWLWVSIMSPHQLTWHSQDIRFAYFIAVATLVGLSFSKEPKRLPVTPVTVVLLLMVVWMTVTTFFAMDRAVSLEPWKQMVKIQFMVFVALYLLHSKWHVQVLIWVLAGSVAFFGVKGGVFTILHGGEYIVYGPPGGFIQDNNALALATIMTMPLLHYLYLRAGEHWVRWRLLVAMVRWGLLAAMALCGFSALGSHSRGGFLAIMAMIGVLWLKSRSRFVTGLALALLVPVAIGFMPEKWTDRMQTIETYEQDESAMSRINAWTTAINVAKDRPLGAGFNGHYLDEYARRYAVDLSDVRPAHSIYFQMLGEHGFVGLTLFLLLWILVWRDASWIITQSRSQKQLHWASDLARMIQVSLVGYAVGGAFLNLAQYDVPYNLLVAVVLTRILVEKEIKSVDQSVELPGAAANERRQGGSEQAVLKTTRFGSQISADNSRQDERAVTR
jgi:probable O-glycosylation ligase (exosortase A-associated)